MKTNGFKYLVAAIILTPALSAPVYACQNPDTAKTQKTIQATDDNENTKPNAYQVFGFGDTKLDSLNQQIGYYSKLNYKNEHNRNYEALKIKSKGFSRPTPSFYDNDTLRNLMGRIDQISQYFKTHENRDLFLKRDSLGHLIGDYFKTPNFLATNSRLLKKYQIDPAKNHTENDANYHRYRDELFKKIPAEVKTQLKELKNLSVAMRKQLQSPQRVAYMKQIPLLIDSIKSYHKRSHVAQYTYASYQATMDVPAEDKRKANDQLMAYIANPDFKRASQLMVESGQKMHDYYQNTPEVKGREEAWKNKLKTILADDYDTIVHPGHGLVFLYSN